MKGMVASSITETLRPRVQQDCFLHHVSIAERVSRIRGAPLHDDVSQVSVGTSGVRNIN
jgi:hypothetical protein